MRMPSVERYQISSAGEVFLPKRTSSFTDVMNAGCGFATLNATTSFGCDAVDITPTAIPDREMSATVRTFAPLVICRTSPCNGAKYRLRAPSFSALKYTPLPSAAHISPWGVRSRLPEMTRGLEPSAFITYSFESTHVALVES